MLDYFSLAFLNLQSFDYLFCFSDNALNDLNVLNPKHSMSEFNMAKVSQEREKCIGCGTCVAVCPDFWVMGDDGKSTLKGGKDNGSGVFELEVDDPGCNKEAESGCPVQIIHVK